MKTVSNTGRPSPSNSKIAESFLVRPARILARLVLIGLLGSAVSGCAMTQLGSMFGGSKEQTTASISDPVIAQDRPLAMAANELAPPQALGPGAAGACPGVSIWQSDAQLTVYEIGRVGDNLAIKHRGEITKTARECEIAPGQVTVKYGVAGRLLLGPLGRSGRVKLPVLIHVTDKDRKKIQTSKIDVIVNVADGKLDGSFSTVQSVSFPIQAGVPANKYSVYITFDKTGPDAG